MNGFKVKRGVAASLFLACAVLPLVLVVVLATRSVVAEEQAVRAVAHQWGAQYPELQIIIKQRMAHLADLVPLYGIGLAALSLELVGAWAIWQGRQRVGYVTLPMATLLAGAAAIVVFQTGASIDTCFSYEGCGVDLGDAQNMLTAAHFLALGGVLACLLTVVLRLLRVAME